MQISVQSAHMISLRRPVARTAARNSASSQELRPVRSIAGESSSSSASSGTVGCCDPDATFTVEWTIGTPKAFAVLTVETMFASSRPASIDRTAPNCAELRRLIVDQDQRRVLRREQVIAKLVSDRQAGHA